MYNEIDIHIIQEFLNSQEHYFQLDRAIDNLMDKNNVKLKIIGFEHIIWDTNLDQQKTGGDAFEVVITSPNIKKSAFNNEVDGMILNSTMYSNNGNTPIEYKINDMFNKTLILQCHKYLGLGDTTNIIEAITLTVNTSVRLKLHLKICWEEDED